ncbi:hypothetical protein H8R04_10255, partial [Clostridium perfringens]|uniref:hypothetical protein n=1 Tax=Clostridium perfringens TaxID=1502 RepID=UPI0018E49DB0
MIYIDFSFLKDKYPILYKTINQAIDNVYTDTDTAMYKVRKFVEQIVDLFLNLEQIHYTKTLNLYGKINLLDECSNLDCIKYLDILRILGNKIIHGGNIDSDLAIKSIKLCYCICQTLMSKYHQTTIITYKNIDTKLLHCEDIIEFDNPIYNEFLDDLKLIIFSLIIREKLDGIGFIEEIKYISYKEFYYYFILALKEYSKISASNMYKIINIKDMLRKNLNTLY